MILLLLSLFVGTSKPVFLSLSNYPSLVEVFNLIANDSVNPPQKKRKKTIDLPSSLHNWFHIVFYPWSTRSPLRRLSQHQLGPDRQSTHPSSPNISDGFHGLEVRILLVLRTIPLSEERHQSCVIRVWERVCDRSWEPSLPSTQ